MLRQNLILWIQLKQILKLKEKQNQILKSLRRTVLIYSTQHAGKIHFGEKHYLPYVTPTDNWLMSY